MDVKLIRLSTLMMEAAYPCEVPTFSPYIPLSHSTTQQFCVQELLLQPAGPCIKVCSRYQKYIIFDIYAPPPP
jgi:hypothetical protein